MHGLLVEIYRFCTLLRLADALVEPMPVRQSNKTERIIYYRCYCCSISGSSIFPRDAAFGNRFLNHATNDGLDVSQRRAEQPRLRERDTKIGSTLVA